MDIPCTSIYCVDIHGISMDIPCISISMDIHVLEYTVWIYMVYPWIYHVHPFLWIYMVYPEMDIHSKTMDIPCIYHVYVGHLHIHGIYHVHMWPHWMQWVDQQCLACLCEVTSIFHQIASGTAGTRQGGSTILVFDLSVSSYKHPS